MKNTRIMCRFYLELCYVGKLTFIRNYWIYDVIYYDMGEATFSNLCGSGENLIYINIDKPFCV